jgi:hypothetical protein
MVRLAMESVSRIETSPEVGISGQFQELLEEMCTNRTVGDKPEVLFSKRVYHCVEEGKFYFRLQDVQRVMERANMPMTRGQIVSRIRTLKGGRKFFVIKGSGQNTWWVPAAAFQTVPEADNPPIAPEVM